MVTPDDVATYVLARLNATTSWTSAVPGGSWFTAGPDVPTSYPYAVFTVDPQPPEWFSGDAYVQTFNVRVGAYSPIGDTGSNPSNIQTAVLSALAWSTATALRNAGEIVLSVRPMASDVKYDKARRQAKDVFVSGQSFEISVQGTRSVI